MPAVLHANLDLFPILLLGCLYLSSVKQPVRTLSDRLFQRVLLATLLLLMVDLFSWLLEGGSPGQARALALLSNGLYFFLVPLVYTFWFQYVYHRLYGKPLTLAKTPRLLLWLAAAVYTFLVASSPYTGAVFSLDEQNRYRRGPLNFLTYLVPLVLMLLCAAMALKGHRRARLPEEKRFCLFLSWLGLVPLGATLLQQLFYGLWIALPATAFAAFMLCLRSQNRQITIDSLAKLNNRGYFDRTLQERLEQEDPFTLFVLDMDRFKVINDTLGHTVGDEALRQAAALLCRLFGATPGFLARIGGDEFALILPCGGDEEAMAVLARLEEALERANRENQWPYLLSISGGFAHRTPGDTATVLIDRADNMMYARKGQKKGGCRL